MNLAAEAGGVEAISLNPDPYKQFPRKIQILTQQTPWDHQKKTLLINEKQLPAGEELNLTINTSYTVEQLQKGMQLLVKIQRVGEDSVDLKLPAFQFGETAEAFYSCFDELLVLNYEQAKEVVLHYSSAKFSLSEKDRQHVANIAAYALADKSIIQIEIDAHTDSWGEEMKNRELSRKRAARIVRVLMNAGVPEEKILQRFHGERYPVADNNTLEGRNKNRRVKIKLIRR